MHIKALILDLDNTIFPVPSIGEELFKPFFDVLQQSGNYEGDLKDIKKDMMRIPFQKVAKQYGFTKQLKEKGDHILQELTYDKNIPTFEDYPEVKKLSCKKFLVTTGYTNMQQSKVQQLGIADDFEEVHIVDPKRTDQTKKDIIRDIMDRYGYKPQEVVVVGDDPESELKAGKELGLKTVLYSKDGGTHPNASQSISSFQQLKALLEQSEWE